jgi:hypothetical protein
MRISRMAVRSSSKGLPAMGVTCVTASAKSTVISSGVIVDYGFQAEQVRCCAGVRERASACSNGRDGGRSGGLVCRLRLVCWLQGRQGMRMKELEVSQVYRRAPLRR